MERTSAAARTRVKIRMRWGSLARGQPGGAVTATLATTPTTRRLLRALPITSTAKRWGDEVYFEVPVKALLEPDARDVVEPGTVCFWVEGSSLAIPFGPTPASRASECRLVARVNVLGCLEGDPQQLATVLDGEVIRVERA